MSPSPRGGNSPPELVEALARLRSLSCIIDGEAVCCDDDGIPSFDRIRYRRYDASVFLFAFDLIELNGDDLRRDPLEVSNATLPSVLAMAAPGLRLNEHIEADGPTVFAHACKMGLEGIVSKRKDRPTAPAAHRTGSRARTRRARRCAERWRRTGVSTGVSNASLNGW
jgi:bifunctional non-homologous end joining protein LigD